MIKFDRLWEAMEKKNISTYRLREFCGTDSKTIRRLRANDNIESKTLIGFARLLTVGLRTLPNM